MYCYCMFLSVNSAFNYVLLSQCCIYVCYDIVSIKISYLVTYLVVVAVGLFGCDGRIMRFVPNSDFENPRNWRTGRLPCHNQRVQFPPATVSVFVQRNNTMLEMVGYNLAL